MAHYKTGMPKITKNKYGTYHCMIYIGTGPDGKRKYKSFSGPDILLLQQQVIDYKNGVYDDAKAEGTDMTVAQAIYKYNEQNSTILSPVTIHNNEIMARNHLLPIMNMKIRDVTEDAVQKAVNEDAKRLSPKTVKNAYGIVARIMRKYRKNFHMDINLPRAKKTEIQIPTQEEIQSLLDQVENTDMEIPCYLAAFCGLRRSEISGLKWSDVDFERNRIHVQRAIVMVHYQIIDKQPKTAAGDRYVHIYSVLRDVLKKYKDREYEKCPPYITLNPANIEKRFNRLRDKNGWDFTFHALRHYAVSVMIANNIPTKYIIESIGHTTDDMIKKVYGHTIDERRRQADDEMDKYFENKFGS